MVVSAGDYFQGAILFNLNKATSGGAATITKGDLLTVNASHQWITAPITAGAGPYAVCARTPAVTDPTVTAVIEGIVYVTAGGVINAFDLVMPDSTTAGKVMSYTATVTPTATTAAGEFRIPAGVYHGHENEGGMATPATVTSLNDIIRIQLRGRV